MPNIPGAALGGNNYESPYVREKRTNQFDIKLTYQLANDNLSVRHSHQNAASYDPGTFGIWGGLKPFAGSDKSDLQHDCQLQQGVVTFADSGDSRRPDLAPQHRDLRGRRSEPRGPVGDSGGEPQRVYERSPDDRRQRLQRVPPGLRDIAPLGSRRAHVDGGDDRDQAMGQSHAQSGR